MRCLTLSLILAVVAVAATAGPAAASTSMSTTATGLAVNGDSTPDWVEVWSSGAAVIASEDRAVPSSCGAYGHASGGCDLSGNPGRTLDIDLADGDDILELRRLTTQVGQVSVTSGDGDDVIDLYGEGVEPSRAAAVDTGAGDDLIDARNGFGDMIDCGTGLDDTVYADDSGDAVTGCEHVFHPADANARTTRVTWLEGNDPFGNFTSHHYLHAVPYAGPAVSLRCRTALTGWQACGGGQDVGPTGGFPNTPHAGETGYDTSGYPAVALGRAGDGSLGLVGPDSEGFFAFDYTAPGAPFLLAALPPAPAGLPRWPIGGSGGLERLCSLDGGAARSCDSPVATIGLGDHVLVAWQRDRAGNLSAPLTQRWHVAPPGVDGPPVQVPVVRGASKPMTSGKPVALKRGRLSIPMACSVLEGCKAKTYTLKFKAFKVTARLRALGSGRTARLAFKLTRRQAKALRHRTVKARLAAPGMRTKHLKLRG